jgi:hypothetical protein
MCSLCVALDLHSTGSMSWCSEGDPAASGICQHRLLAKAAYQGVIRYASISSVSSSRSTLQCYIAPAQGMHKTSG